MKAQNDGRFSPVKKVAITFTCAYCQQEDTMTANQFYFGPTYIAATCKTCGSPVVIQGINYQFGSIARRAGREK